jgi:hypothetical protein
MEEKQPVIPLARDVQAACRSVVDRVIQAQSDGYDVLRSDLMCDALGVVIDKYFSIVSPQMSIEEQARTIIRLCDEEVAEMDRAFPSRPPSQGKGQT